MMTMMMPMMQQQTLSLFDFEMCAVVEAAVAARRDNARKSQCRLTDSLFLYILTHAYPIRH
jgi:hypothetical protein